MAPEQDNRKAQKEQTPEQKRKGEAPEGERAEYPGREAGKSWDRTQVKDRHPKKRL